MYKYYLNTFLFTLLLILHICVDAGIVHANMKSWTELEKGIGYAELQSSKDKASLIHILRFDPKLFQISLFSISKSKHKALTLRQWAEKENLIAAINASMYLPDKTTSTGYMRNKDHLNNEHIGKNFGAFLVTKPHKKDAATLPATDILDKDHDNWQDLIHKYEVVVQNYRLINSKKEILWKKNDSLYPISAVGEDASGHILLIHSSYAITPYKFAQLLLQAPLGISTVMYTEGGHQAGLIIDVPNLTKFWQGNSLVDFLIPGKLDAPLPNIIGITRIKAPSTQ